MRGTAREHLWHLWGRVIASGAVYGRPRGLCGDPGFPAGAAAGAAEERLGETRVGAAPHTAARSWRYDRPLEGA
jgi:hypothetical protein